MWKGLAIELSKTPLNQPKMNLQASPIASSSFEESLNLIRSGKKGREKCIAELHQDQALRNGIQSIVLKGGGTLEDFQAIFNFTLVQFLKTVIHKEDLQITSSLNSYLLGIARNLWYQELRSRKRKHESLPQDFNPIDNSPSIDILIHKEQIKKTLNILLSKLGKNCKPILMLWAANYRMKEIAHHLNYKSAGVVRKRKVHCMKALHQILNDNPSIKTLLAE